jgi:spermidine synthase
MLTTYLLGLALGSLLFAKMLDKVKRQLILLGFIEVCIGLSALLSLWEFSILGTVLQRTLEAMGGNWAALIFSRYMGAFIIMSVPTLLIGIAFPLVNKIYARSLGGVSRGIGSVYSVNTLGSILGSIAAGFLFIPAIGITKSFMLIALINTLLGTLAVLSNMLTKHKLKWASVATTASVVVVLIILIATPSIRFHGSLPGQKIVYYKEGASSTVSVVENTKGYKFLVVNGVYEVSTDYNSLRTFHMLGHLPLLLHEDPQAALVISFGAGVTSGAVARHKVKQIDAVEISSEAIGANSFFVKENQAVLSDPRVNLIIDDGRNYLLRTENRYDVITADATHPTGSDSWVLYTKEFYDLCRNRLHPNGFMAQWLPVHALAPVDYKTIVKTFQSVFTDTTLWFTNDYTILLGSMNELAIDFTQFTERLQEPGVREDLEKFNLADPYFFLGSYIMGGDALDRYSRGMRLNTDNYPFVQSSEKRSRMGTNPSNLMELSGMMKSAVPLLYNIGADRDDVVREVGKHSEVVKHIIRARAYYYMGDIPRQIEEYRKALAILPGDKNTTQLLEIARDLLDDYGASQQ